MRLEEFDYVLPPDRIAQVPSPVRDGSRLLAYGLRSGRCAHRMFRDLPGCLDRPTLIVLNDTKVVPARLHARRPSGGRVELLVLPTEREGEDLYPCLARGAKHLRNGMELAVLTRADEPSGVSVQIVERQREQFRIRFLHSPNGIFSLLGACGEIPLPPYIERPQGPTSLDAERYQSIFARREGAVAAPTASLHFTEQVIESLEQAGHQICRLTLHVGPGTFLPIRASDPRQHVMHAEPYHVPSETLDAIAQAKKTGRRVLAVGTTVVRALEAAAQALSAASGAKSVDGFCRTNLFIHPGYRFRVVDALLTNFHLPRSTLLMLVAALVGRERLLELYQEALEKGYRFFSYGDAMLVVPD